MEVILLQDIEKVGDKHTIISVKPGFGRNYLIPKGLAIVANSHNKSKLDEIQAKLAAIEASKLAEYQEIANHVAGKVLRIGAKAGTSGKIFGSVTNIQIAAALKGQFGLEIDKKKIRLPEEVKMLGTYTATLDLHKQVQPLLTFEVEAE